MVGAVEDITANLSRVFNPGSIAFVGASEAVAKWGFVILNNIVRGGYTGRIYPVNPGRETIMGMTAYPSVRDIPFDVDLAVFTVPAREVLGAIEDCAARGVRAGVVISAGFSELGGESAGLEAELVEKATSSGMAIIGPNGQGVCCPGSNLYAWMPLFYPPGGRASFICQSGNILNMMIARVLESGFGVSKGISSGNQAQLRMEDYYSYLSEDPETEIIVSYVEGVDDGRRFLEKAREVTRRKPVVAVKGGRTAPGVLAARSHTGAIAVADELFSSACGQAGIALARGIDEAGMIASSFLNRPLPRGRRVGIITGGGGLGVVAADACFQQGLDVTRLSSETLRRIGEHLPGWWVPGNPVDLVAGLNLTVVKPILEILIHSGEVDSILFIFIETPRIQRSDLGEGGLDLVGIWDMILEQLRAYVREMSDLMHELGIPVYMATNVKRHSEDVTAWEEDGYMSVFPNVESACSSISAMVRYHEYRERASADV